MNRIYLCLIVVVMAVLPRAVAACSAPICLVDPNTLALTRIITFDDMPSSFGPGRLVDDVLVASGVRFGERFAGQLRSARGFYDQISGVALNPLVAISGGPRETLSITRMSGNNVLNGFGPALYPKRDAQGEGAIAVLFDRDQSALSFDLRGGEGGSAAVQFLRRDGSVIQLMRISPVREHGFGFLRDRGIADIAGFVLTNSDPQGLAFDNLRFELPRQMGGSIILPYVEG